MMIMEKLDAAAKLGMNVAVLWHYDADDETMHDPLSVRIIGTATDVRGVVQLAEVPGDGGRLVATKLFAPLAVIELRGADASDPLRVTHASTPRDDAEGAPVPLAEPYGTCDEEKEEAPPAEPEKKEWLYRSANQKRMPM